MSRRVHVDFRKWPDTPHWQFEMHLLGEDRWGTWLWSPPGSTARRGTEPPQTFNHTNVKLIQADAWWTAIWNDANRFDLYIDIIMPAVWDGDHVTMIDLDLDIERSLDGSVAIVDEDEFVLHQVKLGYPADVVAGAQTTAEDVARRIADLEEPFVETGRRWMQTAQRLG